MAVGQDKRAPAERHTVQLGAQTDFTAQPLDPAFAGPGSGTLGPPGGPRKLAYFRKPGQGAPMFSGACVYGLTGVSPAFSEYDVGDPISDVSQEEVSAYEVTNGVIRTHGRQPIAEPTMTRNARVSAHYDSAPAARFFQGFAQVRWSGLFQGFGLSPRALVKPRPLAVNANPNQVGSKELHKSTVYQPFPPMGSLISSYGEGKAL